METEESSGGAYRATVATCFLLLAVLLGWTGNSTVFAEDVGAAHARPPRNAAEARNRRADDARAGDRDALTAILEELVLKRYPGFVYALRDATRVGGDRVVAAVAPLLFDPRHEPGPYSEDEFRFPVSSEAAMALAKVVPNPPAKGWIVGPPAEDIEAWRGWWKREGERYEVAVLDAVADENEFSKLLDGEVDAPTRRVARRVLSRQGVAEARRALVEEVERSKGEARVRAMIDASLVGGDDMIAALGEVVTSEGASMGHPVFDVRDEAHNALAARLLGRLVDGPGDEAAEVTQHEHLRQWQAWWRENRRAYLDPAAEQPDPERRGVERVGRIEESATKPTARDEER